MNDKMMVIPRHWITQVCKEDIDTTQKSIHFNSFIGYREEKLQGIALLEYASALLMEARAVVENMAQEKKDLKTKPLIYLPLGATQDLIQWKDSNWSELGKEDEPPSLYLLSTKDLFDIYVEEYRCPVNSNFEVDNILALFRCVRDQQSIENNWEFTSGVYLYCAGDF